MLADAVYTTSLKNIYSKAVKKVTNPVILQDLQKFSLSQLTSSTALLKTLHPETEHFVKTQIMNAIRNVFYMAIGFSAITFFAAFFVTNERLPKNVEKPQEQSNEKETKESDSSASDVSQPKETEEDEVRNEEPERI